MPDISTKMLDVVAPERLFKVKVKGIYIYIHKKLVARRKQFNIIIFRIALGNTIPKVIRPNIQIA